MKIIFFTENFPPETNAAATRVYERALYWIKWGHQVTIITCNPNFPYGRLFDGYQNCYNVEKIDGIRVVRVQTYITHNRGVLRRTMDFLSFMINGYRAATREPKPDVVVSTSPQFFAAVAAWWYAKREHLHYVFELGDLWPASITAVGAMRYNIGLRFIEALELKMYRDSDAVIVLTKSFKKNLVSRGIPSKKIAVVINGVDLWRYKPRIKNLEFATQMRLPDAGCIIGYIGTHGMAHALGNVLDAAKLLRKRNDIQFLFVGAGVEREALIARATHENLRNVLFLEAQPKNRMPDVWSLCDVALVHLKASDVFASVIPSKIFEAMGMGLPILFSGPSGEGSQVVLDAEAGLVTPPEDPEALANSVIVFADNLFLRTAMAKKSKAAALRYSREVQAKRMIKALKACIDNKGYCVADIASKNEEIA